MKAGAEPYIITEVVDGAQALRMLNSQALGTHRYPVLWRGYTNQPDDGGMVQIKPLFNFPIMIADQNGNTSDYLFSNIFQNFEFESATNDERGVVYARDTVFRNCVFRNTANSGSRARAFNGDGTQLHECTFESAYKPASGYSEVVTGSVGIYNSRIIFGDVGYRAEPDMQGEYTHYAHSMFDRCTFHGLAGSRAGVRIGRGNIRNCNFYNSTNGVECINGSHVVLASETRIYITNCIFHSHATAIPISSGANHGIIMAQNKVYNCTAGIGGAEGWHWSGKGPYANTTTLTEDPFVNPAAGDFSIRLEAAPQLYRTGIGDTHAGAGHIPEDYPGAANVRSGTAYARSTGSTRVGILQVPSIVDVRQGVTFDAGNKTGLLALPDESDVRDGVGYDSVGINRKTGSLALPAVTDVRAGVDVGGDTGLLDIPAEEDVIKGVKYDNQTKTGLFQCPPVPEPEDVRAGVLVGVGMGTLHVPEPEDVRIDIPVDDTTGLLDLPQEKHVLSGVEYDNRTKTGTYEPTVWEPRNIIFEDKSHGENTLERNG